MSAPDEAITFVKEPRDCSFHAHQVVTVHHTLPTRDRDRAWLGVCLGFGLSAGVGAFVGVVTLASKVIRALFA